ncbi:MAG: WXG100 family type VII secretion target [Bacilli bacterium]|nr:WXG100 family type VII secretion target [Bacilli bacterium]
MNEFEQKDYQGARGLADSIKGNADNIMDIFNDVDTSMKSLYGDAWQSTGADSSRDRYNELRKNYEAFYNKVVTMKDHIYKVTAANEEADAAVSQTLSNI